MGGIVLIDERKEAQIVVERLDPLFTAQWHCRYRIDVVYNQFGHGFNFFLDIRRKNHRERSIPLHTVKSTDLEILENVIDQVKQQTDLTLNFVDFGKVRWPRSQRWIR